MHDLLVICFHRLRQKVVLVNTLAITKRNRHILDPAAKGRMAWQKAHGYGRRSLFETTMGQYKSIIGDRLHARHDDAHPVELTIGIKVLNRMMNLAKSIFEKAG